MRILLFVFCCLLLNACQESPRFADDIRPSPPITSTAGLELEEAGTAARAPRPTAVPASTATPALTQTPTVPLSPTAEITATPAFPRYGGPPLKRENLGVQIHIHREDRRALIRHLQALQVGWVKVQVSWKLYQPQPDAFAEDRFSELDALVEAATNNDIKVLLSVSKAPEWSRPTTEMDGPPLDYTLYRDFMAALAARYKDRVTAYELWNEPNLQREWNGSPLNPADVTRLIASGAEGVRQVDPMATIVSGAPATTGINDAITAIDDRIFLRGMLDAGIVDIVDAIGVHPYGWANPPDSTHLQPDPSVPSHNNHPSFFFRDTLSDYETLLETFGVSAPLWVTEFGWGSFDGISNDDGEPAQPPAGADFMTHVSEWQQAVYILRAFEIGDSNNKIGPMILWNLNFGPLLKSDFSESGYSILRPDGRPRPAYLALEAANKA